MEGFPYMAEGHGDMHDMVTSACQATPITSSSLSQSPRACDPWRASRREEYLAAANSGSDSPKHSAQILLCCCARGCVWRSGAVLRVRMVLRVGPGTMYC